LKTAVICGLAGICLAAAAVPSRAQDPYADTVVSYTPGTGISASYEDSGAALGAPDTGATITAPAYSTSQIVGIGNGGELTLEFDTPIANDPTDHADGLDFTIFGNDFFVNGSNGISGIYDHAGLTVWVSQDNITYYELNASFGADSDLPTNGSGNPALPVNPSLTLSSFVGVSAAQAATMYGDSAGGASYSIGWAEDTNGDAVDLSSISYVKIEGSGGYGYIDAISRVESVPEPATAGLWAGGAILLVCLRRARRPKAQT
jgi:hypothetical protein